MVEVLCFDGGNELGVGGELVDIGLDVIVAGFTVLVADNVQAISVFHLYHFAWLASFGGVGC